MRKTVQDFIIKVAGKQVGRLFAEKSIMRLIPVANAGIGYFFNNSVTKKVGKWAKVRAKIRSSAFKQVKQIEVIDKDVLVWVLPIIFYVGISTGKLTDNVLTIYAQILKCIKLSETQLRRVQELIDDENLSQIFAVELSKIKSKELSNALYDIALTTAAVNLEQTKNLNECLNELTISLGLKYDESTLSGRIDYFKR